MAKLSAHGTELLRVEQASYRLAYMADGKILRDSGGGWKLHKRCKPGVDPEANAEQRRAFYANVTPDRYHRAHYRERMVNEFPGLETRVRVHTTISLMSHDPDGVWSELDGTEAEEDLDTIVELCAAYRAAHAEGEAAKAAKAKA
jgi:hypothetical protein